MRKWILTLAAFVATGTASAQSRPDSLKMTCPQASGLVRSAGSVVLGSGPYIYDRYVVGCNFCPDYEFRVPAWIRTSDNPHCFVGYTCKTDTIFPAPSCGITGYRGP
jgi:hypothetical protein